MKNKKGFTIVELVIVIAVIAILAAVLIPTFSGVISKANQSSALQTARSTLTNALNMSSNATLAGQKADGGYQTMIVVDGHAYGYTGNELKSIDYPTSVQTIFMKGGKIDANAGKNSFNSIAIAAENLIDNEDNKPVDTTKDLTGHTFKVKNVDDEILAWSDDNKTGCTDITGIKVSYVDGRYYLNYTPVYAKTSDTAIDDEKDYYTRTGDETNGYTYTLVASPVVSGIDTYYEVSSYTWDAEVLINSDFSNKVVVFTTFG